MVNASRRKGVNLEGLAMLPEGCGWLMVEFGANSAAEAESQARHLMETLDHSSAPPNMRLFTDPRQAKRIWDIRESSLGVTSHVPGEPLRWEGFEDSAVSPEKLGAYLRDLRKLMQDFHYDGSFYGHFGHACVHTRMDYDLESKKVSASFVSSWKRPPTSWSATAARSPVSMETANPAPSFSPKMFGPELMQAFHDFKSLWDPDWKMNPGKLIDPYRLDENLRLGAGYDPWQPETHFKFPTTTAAWQPLPCAASESANAAAIPAESCVPASAHARRRNSTRGRAHLLWEMTKGDVI